MKAVLQIDGLEKEIKKIIKEAIEEGLMKIRADLLPYISDEEQNDMEKLYKTPNTDIAKRRKIKI